MFKTNSEKEPQLKKSDSKVQKMATKKKSKMPNLVIGQLTGRESGDIDELAGASSNGNALSDSKMDTIVSGENNRQSLGDEMNEDKNLMSQHSSVIRQSSMKNLKSKGSQNLQVHSSAGKDKDESNLSERPSNDKSSSGMRSKLLDYKDGESMSHQTPNSG